MDVFAQEDVVESFLAGESKDDFNNDLLLAHVDNDDNDNDNDDIQFKRENVLDCGDLDENVLGDCDVNGSDDNKDEKVVEDLKKYNRNASVTTSNKCNAQCLNKMHVMEDVREGSDVPGAQPSSPGHAEQRPDAEEELSAAQACNENCVESEAKLSNDFAKEMAGQENGNDETKIDGADENKNDTEQECKIENDAERNGESSNEKESAIELESNSVTEDAGSNDSTIEENQYAKRKLDGEDAPSKRIRTDLEQNYILRDKILNEYIDNAGCSSVQQIEIHMDQILSEIRTLNELAKEKEKEWNNIIHLKKIKEELLLRVQRRKQILILNNDKIDWNDREASPEPPHADNLDDRVRIVEKQSLLKHNIVNANNSGLVIFSTSGQGSVTKNFGEIASANNKKKFPSAIIEINGQSGDLKQNRQRPVIDVQSIIADYRQRHPEAVPRRGRRIRSILNSQGDSSMVNRIGHGGVMNFSSMSLGSGSQVKHNLTTAGIEANSELGLLLTAVNNAKQSGSKSTDGQAHLETASFKDVLMQFAKLSQNERQDLLQTAMKQPPPYSEVTVHPVPAHTQSSSNSLLHGILTKAQSRSDSSSGKSSFSPTLARLLTAPERASACSPHATTNHNSTPVSISEMLSNNKARNEITITPVGGQFEVGVKEKTDEEEAEDSADRLVIDEGEALDGRSRTDNGSDAGDEVPQCQGCNQKPAQFVCAGCGNQWYCSRECQVVAWDEHSEVCSG